MTVRLLITVRDYDRKLKVKSYVYNLKIKISVCPLLFVTIFSL